MHAKSQAKRWGWVGVAALVGLLAFGGPGTARAQLIDRLPPLPPVTILPEPDEILTLLAVLGSAVDCVQTSECRNGFDCCDPCATRADGTYCGDEVFPPSSSNARYFCQNGQTAATANCSNGCEDGQCKEPGGGATSPW